MKFSTALTSLILIVPLFAGDAFAAAAFGRFGQGKGGNKGGNANKSAANNSGASKTSAAATSAATAAATSAANTTSAANNGTAAAASNSTVLANTGNNAGSNATANNGNPQDSLTLNPAVLATGFEQNGQAVQEAGQVASLTSSNNFINFCLTVPNLPITNGQQIKTGSCNPAPMGVIAATTNIPSSKFVVPVNGQDVAAANAPFTITMAIQNLETGNFVNAASNYYAAPQQVNGQGDIIGHTHFTVQAIPSFTSTTPLDASTFAFFKGVNQAATNGQLSEAVTAGLPAGFYRVCSINTDANHAPCLVAVAQHGNMDDCVYFSVGQGGNNGSPFGSGAAANNATGANNAAGSNSTAASSAAASAASATVAGNGAGKGGAAASTSSAASTTVAGNGAGKGGAAASTSSAASTTAAGNGAGKGGNQAGNGNKGNKGGKRGRFLLGRQSRLGRDY